MSFGEPILPPIAPAIDEREPFTDDDLRTFYELCDLGVGSYAGVIRAKVARGDLLYPLPEAT